MPRTIIKNFLIALVSLSIIGYTGYQSRNLVLGASLTVSEPTDGAIVTEELMLVRGTATRISRLALDGNQIFTDTAGAFSEKILLAPGWNLITLEAQDRFKKTLTRSIEVIYDAPVATTTRFSTTHATSSLITEATASSSTR